MLCLGNFIYAYHKLSKMKDPELLKRALDDGRDPKEVVYKFQHSPKLVDISPISCFWDFYPLETSPGELE